MSFSTKLRAAWSARDSMLCVGLDPDLAKLPNGIEKSPRGVLEFCRAIVDTTSDLVCAFKPQIAYFAAIGAERELEELCSHIRTNHPEVVLILDAKRGDIGDTAALYAREAFERYGADAVTVNPYLGTDSLEPFFAHAGRGTIVLCRTSNAGSGEFQGIDVNGAPLYEHIATTAATKWASRGDVALVVGATYPAELARVRSIVGDMPLLVPGIGAQGGDVEAVVRAGRDSTGYGLIINSSRAVLYAGAGDDFADRARAVASATRDTIRSASN
jgi:orotidine-5'-phosphate decarboxylase